jgi:RNA polymerase sigma-70 factor (ECF subfamily)
MTGLPRIEPALVRAAQRGDRIAVADLMDALTPYVGRVCGPIALQEGPDAAQEALIAILRNLGGLREPGDPGMVRVQQWRPDTEAERTSPAALWGGVARKP